MNYCKKCGTSVEDNLKFCTSCGAEIKINNSKGKTGIIAAAVIVMLCIFSAGFYYFNIKKNDGADKKNAIVVEKVDAEKFPEVCVTITNDDNLDLINDYKVTIKENEVYQKDIKIEKNDTDNNYVVSYECSDKKSAGNRNAIISFSRNNKEIITEFEYTAKDVSKEPVNTVSSADNSVNTYDEDEEKVKSVMEEYLREGVRSINTKNIAYVRDLIDPSSSLVKEVEQTLASYKEQQITEDLLEYNVENIEKISDGFYEVTTYEGYRIYYGKKNEIKNMDFRSKYIIKKAGTGFKVNSIKDITTL